MPRFYAEDLAYIQAAAFGQLARGAAPEIVRRLKGAAIPIRRAADLGCGAGVLSSALWDAGFEVTGIDQSADLLALARAAAPHARFLHASLYEAELPGCQAMVALGEPLTYHDENAPAEAVLDSFFRSAAYTLPPGGLLIFDVIETGEPSLAGRSWISGDDWAVLAESSEDPAARRLVRRIETFRKIGQAYRRGRETHCIHLFEGGELTRRLERHGFAVETAQAYGQHLLAPRRRAFFCTRR